MDRIIHIRLFHFVGSELHFGDKQPAPEWRPNSAFVLSKVGAVTFPSYLALTLRR